MNYDDFRSPDGVCVTRYAGDVASVLISRDGYDICELRDGTVCVFDCTIVFNPDPQNESLKITCYDTKADEFKTFELTHA